MGARASDRTGLQVTSRVTLDSLTSLNLLACFDMVVRRFKQDVVHENTLGLSRIAQVSGIMLINDIF